MWESLHKLWAALLFHHTSEIGGYVRRLELSVGYHTCTYIFARFSSCLSTIIIVVNYFLSIVMTRQRLSITNTNSDTNTRPPCHNDNDKQPVRPELLTSTLGTTAITTTCSTIMRQHADTIFRDNVRRMEDNRPQHHLGE